jgi:hypothetical protein
LAAPIIQTGAMAKASRVQPFDVYTCAGCRQTLTFNEHGFVPKPQLDGCQSKCDWTLVARDGVEVGVQLARRLLDS